MTNANARFIARAYVNNEKTDIEKHWIVLQSTVPGTCQLSVNTKVKKLSQVAVDLGWGNMIDRVFFGYVERIMPTNKGWSTLFCREFSAALKFNFSIMLRHPTLQHVLAELTKQSGVEFVIPNKAYAQTAIPCFYCDSSGYAMLDNIGRAYQIKDFIWQQQGNGKVFVGSYADCFWQGKNIEIPNGMMTEHQAGKIATMPAAPMIRPNVMANGERIEKIEFKETNMTISW